MNKKQIICIGLIILVLVYWIYLFETVAVRYMSFDINPSFQIGFNSTSEVVSVKGYNEDGKKIAKELLKEIKGKGRYDTVKAVIDKLIEDKYISSTETTLLITYTGKNKTDVKDELEVINSNINDQLDVDKYNVKLYYLTASKNDYKKALKENITVGKYKFSTIIANADSNLELKTLYSANINNVETTTNIVTLMDYADSIVKSK